jgi:hypothetical protein
VVGRRRPCSHPPSAHHPRNHPLFIHPRPRSSSKKQSTTQCLLHFTVSLQSVAGAPDQSSCSASSSTNSPSSRAPIAAMEGTRTFSAPRALTVLGFLFCFCVSPALCIVDDKCSACKAVSVSSLTPHRSSHSSALCLP